jgi:hypothetical protein
MPVKIIKTLELGSTSFRKVVFTPERRHAGPRPNPKRPIGRPRAGSILEPVATREFVVGLDLGQAADFTALVAAERVADGYAVPLIARTRGRSYPEIVARVADLMAEPPIGDSSHLVVDATGVGRPVMDMLRGADLDPIAVSIHGGEKVTGRRGWLRVPKRDLISVLLVAFQSGLIKISSELEHATALAHELAGMRRRITAAGTDQYGVWREGEHDDLVLALALAVWYAERLPQRMRITKRPEPSAEEREQLRAASHREPLTPESGLQRIEERKSRLLVGRELVHRDVGNGQGGSR